MKQFARAKLQRYIVGWGPEYYTVKVEVMATVKPYAMVRRKGCLPFVLMTKLLTPINRKASK